MYIGIDLGTSGIKAIVLDESGIIVASKTEPLRVYRPKDLWSEQNPEHWWTALNKAVLGLKEQVDLSNIISIGLSGQMHGATLIDANGEVIRPCILWNDGRSAQECLEIEEMVPNCRDITGNMVMSGFTAPKLLWVKRNEPENFARIDKVLLPKDYLRFRMSGDFATDMSDAAGTSWLDVKNRCWSDKMLSATGLTQRHMPQLYEGTEVTGLLSNELANKWGMPCVPIVAGAGDNAAGAIGVGIVEQGQAMLSLGTSGVYFSVTDTFTSDPENALHSFCHAIPNKWHTMSVMLSAASCLAWFAKTAEFADVKEMIEEAEKAQSSESILFLPYLSGERTPHNDPQAKGAFFGLTPATTREQMALAILEGVGFALADCMDVLHEASGFPNDISLIGGGARSVFWRQMLADIFGIAVSYRVGGDVGPALGAARLAHVGVKPEKDISSICPITSLVQTYQPVPDKHNQYMFKRRKFNELYSRLKGFSF
ncbi:xylulokinase [Vibrio marisflavi]|uniref:Xylulose kinase n=1 Tax=Vibrio marisflavi CECT 7928 TaxID=634439 RepID=A0ABM8ZZQ4_9VIBR|nr:xylulokinase [Vibrio marisflavi]CAH0536429.1 Xylulose kinase [Vibrio marisflavi CECT 7928]